MERASLVAGSKAAVAMAEAETAEEMLAGEETEAEGLAEESPGAGLVEAPRRACAPAGFHSAPQMQGLSALGTEIRRAKRLPSKCRAPWAFQTAERLRRLPIDMAMSDPDWRKTFPYPTGKQCKRLRLPPLGWSRNAFLVR